MTSEEFAREVADKIERALLTRLEEIEGRVPSNEELAKHLLKLSHQDMGRGYSFLWKGKRIVEAGGMTEKDGKLVVPVRIIKDES